MKNALVVLISRLKTAEEGISELESKIETYKMKSEKTENTEQNI